MSFEEKNDELILNVLSVMCGVEATKLFINQVPTPDKKIFTDAVGFSLGEAVAKMPKESGGEFYNKYADHLGTIYGKEAEKSFRDVVGVFYG